MMRRDSNRHLEEKIAEIREENARLRAELYGKKSERTVASDLDITIEDVPAKEEPKPTAADETQQNKTDKPAKRTRRLRVHYTREKLPEEERPNRQLYRAHVRRNFVNCAKNSNDPQWN